MSVANLNDIGIHYAVSGNPSGKPVVLIHGFPFSHQMWDPQLSALETDYRVIRYDVRGHGRSEVGDGQYHFEFFVDDLLALLDELKLEQVVACGLSMGGYIALRAHERAPERFSALVLCDTRPEADSNEAKLKRAASMKSVRTQGVKAFADAFVKSVFAPRAFSEIPAAVEKIKSIILSNPTSGIRGTLLALASRTDSVASLARIQVPSLVIVGAEDSLTPPSVARSMHSMIPGARLVEIPGAGHLPNLEAPDAFNRALLDFLSAL